MAELFSQHHKSNDSLDDRDLSALVQAKIRLESPSLTARLASIVGQPLEKGFALLPKGWAETLQKAVKRALLSALEVAVVTIKPNTGSRASEFMHKVMVGASGGIGGAFGLLALPVELPISTTIMLRSIAKIARDEGHNLGSVHTRLHCLEVFALGGRSQQDDAAESTYWAVRAALGKTVSEAVAYFTEKGLVDKSAPAIARLISTIASRFGVVLSEQVAAKAVPVIGAAGGSIINVLFMHHFQDMARGHFIVKRLEAKYGVNVVRKTYNSIVIPVG
jgi:hypothetical protein